MARRSPRTMASIFADFLRTVFRDKPRDRRRELRRGFAFESLEGRAMLASDFGAISGLVYRDATGDGFTAGEEVVGATINLYTDDGDGIFEPGAGDTLDATDTTDAAGRYRFDGLSEGDYWIEKPAQSVGGVLLSGQNSSLVSISALEAQGTAGTTIDDYTDVGPSVSATGPAPNSAFDEISAPSVLGGERDLFVELVSGLAGESVQLNGIAGALNFSATSSAQGRYVSVWDGADGDGSTIAFTGLANQDLTSGGTATAIRMMAGVDLAGTTARLRVYTDANNWSEQSLPIATGAPSELVFLFSGFAQGGTATGPADFSDVGAIELQIDATAVGSDGSVTLLELLAPTVKTADFTNPADLSLTKTVTDPSPTVGQSVTFTITVANAGPGAANNIVVTDLLPTGLTYDSDVPSQGSYDEITGIWTVGSIDAGNDATLEIVATVDDPGSLDNDAEVTDVDEFDPDSTPGNNVPTEDDQDSANVDAAVIDLSVTKTVNNATPGRNEQVTFTITVANAGPDGATGVEVTDLLPAGMTFVSSTVGTDYNENTGVWTVGSIAGGGSVSMDLVATVTTSTAKVNTAEVTAADQGDVDSTPDNANAGEDDQDSVTLTPAIADISVSKTVDNATPDKNDTISFTIIVANAGPDAATDVVVTDLLPSGLTVGNASPTAGSYNQTNGEWTIPTLASGGSATLTITATATTSGAKINKAELTAVDQFDSDSTPGNDDAQEDDQQSVTVTPEIADLSVTKTVTNATPDRDDVVSFEIVVTNGGPDTATNVVVTDQLPAGLQIGTATTATGSYNQTNGQWTIPSLASGASATLTITATATTAGVKTNTAEITASDQFDSDSTPGNNVGTEDDQDSVDVTPQVADLSVVKEVDDATPNPGQTITFTIRVINSSTTQQATGVTLTDQIPAGMTIGTATTASGTYDQNTGIWNIGTIAPNTTATLTITATSTTAAVKTNTARLTTADQLDPDSTPGNTVAGEDDESTITITPNVADVRLSKQVSTSSPQLNQQVTFTIRATNDGPQAATNLQITDQLPAGLTLVSSNAPTGTTFTGGVWTIPSLASGATLELTIVATASQLGSVTNTAQVTAMNEFDSDSTPNNNVATEDDQASATLNTTQLVSPRLCTIVWHRS